MNPRNWWLYLIECRNGSFYTGIALDVDARYAQHVAGQGAKYTRAHRPLRLLGRIPFQDHRSAAQAEIAFKKLTKYQKQDRIPHFLKSYPVPLEDASGLLNGELGPEEQIP